MTSTAGAGAHRAHLRLVTDETVDLEARLLESLRRAGEHGKIVVDGEPIPGCQGMTWVYNLPDGSALTPDLVFLLSCDLGYQHKGYCQDITGIVFTGDILHPVRSSGKVVAWGSYTADQIWELARELAR